MIDTFFPISVSLAPLDEAKETRRAFSRVTSEFKREALRLLQKEHMDYGDPEENCLPLDVHLYQVHHILPVSLGGKNDFNNLAWVDPTLHGWIHKHINRECEGMIAESSRMIRLPIKPGILWRL